MIFSLFAVLDSLRALVPRSSENTVAKMVRFDETWTSVAALTGTNALAEMPCCHAKMKSRLVGLKLIPQAAVTAHGSNYGSIIVRKRTAAAPGTQVAIATFASDTVTTDDLVAFAARDLYTVTAPIYLNNVAAADLDFAEGDVLTVEVTKAASGVTIPIFTLQAEFEGRD